MELHFRKMGEGQPLIILHGLMGSSDNWQTMAKKLSDNYTVYLVDQRNHGRSPHHDDFSYEVLANDLDKFIEDNNIEKPYLMGHSMGGKTAMNFALKHPNKVDRLIVVDIAPKDYRHDTHSDILDALISADIKDTKSRAEIEEQIAQTIEEEDVRLFLMKNLYRKDDNSFAWRMNIDAIKDNIEKITDEIKSDNPYEGPTLFIRGGMSRYIKPEDYAPIEKLFPNVQIETIENAGHWLHAQAPDEFYRILTEFLNTNNTWQPPSI